MSAERWVIGDHFGLPIPADPAALHSGGAAFLTEAFRISGALDAGNAVTRISQFDEVPGGSTGRKLLLTVEYDTPGAHTDLFVKFSRDFDDPIPPEATNLDMITFFFAYHDVTYMPVDRAEMNKKMFAALKPGGYLVIADHSARPGDGTSVGKTLHRIEESTLRHEVEAAGFKFVAEADFLRNPADPRDAAVFHPQQPNDEFVLKYQKPMS